MSAVEETGETESIRVGDGSVFVATPFDSRVYLKVNREVIALSRSDARALIYLLERALERPDAR